MLKDKVILLTGGTGSFGKKFTEIVLREYSPRAIRIYSRGELLQMEMRQKFNNDERLRFFIGDVRDRDRLHRAMTDADIIVHAAALKQVPTCEYNPIEAIRTNIDGAANIIDAAINNGIDHVMAISTDKAVQPVNLYGATKLVSEKLFVQGNAYAGKRRTRFSCVRYGNVVGSRGSVIPLFLEQRKKGVVTITDEQMTRFWITLDQGVRFVINCIERMQGGEIFVPRIPSMKVIDLADVVAPDAEKKIIGIRPGEKLHEVLLTQEEALHACEFDDFFVIEPEFPFWKKGGLGGARPLAPDFSYASNTNTRWLARDEIVRMIEEL